MSQFAKPEENLQIREWQQFLDAAVHDLRAALRAVGTSAELLSETCGDREARDSIATILEGVHQIDVLSKRLASYSRALQMDALSACQVSLELALRSAVEQLQPLIREKEAQIAHAQLPKVFGNLDQLTALFREILSNGLAYCHGTPPRIEITVNGDADYWRFAVKDHGLGVERQYWERIFQPFQRLHGGHRSGTGLGLAICRKIVEAHGGRIWVESEPGYGSTFFFTLPRGADCGGR
jgi:signal transduction histidine kinase